MNTRRIASISKRLAVQGFTCPVSLVEEIEPWFRFAPALCLTFTALGLYFREPWIFVALALTALYGAFFSHHPFDYLYNHSFRFLTRTSPLPDNPPPRRFACKVATVWLLALAYLFAFGHETLGYILGGIFLIVAGLMATMHICIASYLYNFIFKRGSRSLE